jgi:hypothetical protein
VTTRQERIDGVTDALNKMFDRDPKPSLREARHDLQQLRADITIMLAMVDEMEKMGVPPDFRVE